MELSVCFWSIDQDLKKTGVEKVYSVADYRGYLEVECTKDFEEVKRLVIEKLKHVQYAMKSSYYQGVDKTVLEEIDVLIDNIPKGLLGIDELYTFEREGSRYGECWFIQVGILKDIIFVDVNIEGDGAYSFQVETFAL